MKSFLLRSTFAILLSVAELSSFAADSAEKSAATSTAKRTLPDEQLVITKGFFSYNDRGAAATVRNLVNLVSQNHPNATITLVGVENIVIENLTLTLRRTGTTDDRKDSQPQSVLSILTAFSQASGGLFRVQAFSENDFLLSNGNAPARQITEVFNLATVIKPNRSKSAIEENIRELEIRSTVLRNRYGEQYPQLVSLRDEIEVMKAQLTQNAAAVPSTAKLIEQIEDAVGTTLHTSSRNPALPEFKYHAGTNLLIAVGTDSAIDATRKVIAALEKTPQ